MAGRSSAPVKWLRTSRFRVSRVSVGWWLWGFRKVAVSKVTICDLQQIASLCRQSPVDIFPMPDLHDENRQLLVLDCIDDPVLAFAEAVEIV